MKKHFFKFALVVIILAIFTCILYGCTDVRERLIVTFEDYNLPYDDCNGLYQIRAVNFKNTTDDETDYRYYFKINFNDMGTIPAVLIKT